MRAGGRRKSIGRVAVSRAPAMTARGAGVAAPLASAIPGTDVRRGLQDDEGGRSRDGPDAKTEPPHRGRFGGSRTLHPSLQDSQTREPRRRTPAASATAPATIRMVDAGSGTALVSVTAPDHEATLPTSFCV